LALPAAALQLLEASVEQAVVSAAAAAAPALAAGAPLAGGRALPVPLAYQG
jgi:hypothetical protein